MNKMIGVQTKYNAKETLDSFKECKDNPMFVGSAIEVLEAEVLVKDYFKEIEDAHFLFQPHNGRGGSLWLIPKNIAKSFREELRVQVYIWPKEVVRSAFTNDFRRIKSQLRKYCQIAMKVL